MLSKSFIAIAQNSNDIFRLGGTPELKISKKYPDLCKYIACNHSSLDEYHSFAHLYGTALIAQQLCFEKLIDFYQSERICIAAFLHDYCYRDKLDDDNNMSKSIHILCDEYEEIKKTFANSIYPDAFNLFNFNEILRFIKYTTYTEQWACANVPENAFKILRDADQLYSFIFICDDMYDVLFKRFSSGFNEIDFIKNQLKRTKNIHFLTDEGNELFEVVKPKVVDFYHRKLGRI